MKKRNTELDELIFQWQNEPDKYINLLIDNVHITLKKICKVHIAEAYVSQSGIDASASSLVNEAFLKLKMGGNKNKIESVREFYCHLSNIVRSILLDRSRKSHAVKRILNRQINKVERADYALQTEQRKELLDDYEQVDQSLGFIKQIQPAIFEALSFKYHSALSNEEIAHVMQKSTKTINSHIKQGRMLIKASLSGVSLEAS